MVDLSWLPWRAASPEAAGDADGDGTGTAGETDDHTGAVVVCEFQDGTLAVYEDRVVIDRASRSRFDDRTVPTDEITGVVYEAGITVGYVQVEQAGVDLGSGGMLSDPVDRNTLHFGRGGRDCAREARDAILERATG